MLLRVGIDDFLSGTNSGDWDWIGIGLYWADIDWADIDWVIFTNMFHKG